MLLEKRFAWSFWARISNRNVLGFMGREGKLRLFSEYLVIRENNFSQIFLMKFKT